MFRNAEARAMGRASLKGNWLMAILVFVVVGIISAVISLIPDATISSIVSFVILSPITFGIYAYYLQLIRGQQPKLETIFSGFQKFGTTLLLNLLMTIFVLLWTLLLIIPGIIASFRYAMAWYILHDNPEIRAIDAIRQSKAMMQGYKGQLFLLYLSFIGWFILCILSFGIGFLWLLPYIQSSSSAFYENLKAQSTSQVN
jgi:uncharacterized membrane protein